MTDVAEPATVAEPVRPAMPTLAAGLGGGLVLGILARAWMRLIAEEPEFSWNGTLFIVIGFTIFGFTQSIVAVARRGARRRWKLTSVRVLGSVGMLPLFVGAGSLMFPTVVGAGLTFARVEWPRRVRRICLLVAAGPVLFVGKDLVGSFGWSPHTVVGFVAMLAIYSTIIRATRFTFAAQSDGWRLKRWARISIFVLLGLAVAYITAGVVLQ